MNKRGFLFVIVAVLLLLAVGAATMGSTAAQDDPFPVTLTMSGPATAVSGQEIAYRVRYRWTAPSTDPLAAVRVGFRIPVPQNTTFVSTQVVFGSAVLFESYEYAVDWGQIDSDETEGQVELTVKVDADYLGQIFASAYEGGTETTSSNIVETQILAPGTLPEAGGGPVAGSGSPVATGLLALVGTALLGTGAAAHRIGRPS